ncbi:hypothetical protein [Streptomyces sp. AS02]|uniref:hypothetical protein n=1 Tax=Streptomyces sp. AS02 TaxID=2938946 RepID=UPI0020218D8C|nr:hypothetical protein [Streptomyces sp. AS02]MCL8014917.1 signal peptide protein [Streptomyces sp. AS02]
MFSKRNRLRVALVAPVAALAGLATVGPAAAAAQHAVTGVAATPQDEAPAVPVDFVDGPANALPADGASQEFAVTYRNGTSADREVAPQLLVESPDAGPFLDSSDIRVEQRTTDGCWETVRVGSQTGTLYTDLAAARRTLHAGEELTEVYRLTVLDPGAMGTVHPRVAVFD